MLFNFLTFHFYISGGYFVFMIILVEINVEGFLWKCVKKGFDVWQNNYPLLKDIGHFQQK